MQNWESLIVEESEKPYNIRHRCFLFSRNVIEFVKTTKHDWIYRSMFDQLVRSATSIGANLVEGQSGSSRKDFINFIVISLKSANETKYWLCLIRDTMEVDKPTVESLIKEATELSKIIGSIIVKTKQG